MNAHKRARLTPRGREVLISRLERGQHLMDMTTAMGVGAGTAYKWWRRYRAEGLAGLRDRSPRLSASPMRTPEDIEAKVIAPDRERRISHCTAAEIGVSRAAVGRVLVRHGLNRWRDLEPAEPVRRYEHDKPGEMIHISIRKLGRFNKVGHRITGDRTGQSNNRGAGNTSMSASTITPVSASPTSCPARKRKAPSLSWKPPSSGMKASESPSSGS